MRVSTQPKGAKDPGLKQELVEHAILLNLLTDGRLSGTNNATNAAPTSGTHAQGDYVRNSAASIGKFAGWVFEGSIWHGVGQIGALKNTTANRPNKAFVGLPYDSGWSGYLYFDTTLAAGGKPIWWNGSAWVDATGATV